MSRVLCVLPARIGSHRLPRKPLREIAGRPLIRWSWEAAERVPVFDEIRVATDSPEVVEAVEGFGGRALVTAPDHRTGTDRVAEAAGRPWATGYDLIVNFQADEPFLDSRAVERAVETVRSGRAPVATVAEPLSSRREWRSPDVVKVVRGSDGRALYFSRAPVPHVRDRAPGEDGPAGDRYGGGEDTDPLFLRHAGLYAFRREALERWTELRESRLERAERLEQLRALEAGLEIHVAVGRGSGPGVDTPRDLERAARRLERTDHRAGDAHGS